MTKVTCFSALLGGKKKKSKAMRKVADAKEANDHDSSKVIRPVEFVDTMATAGVSKYGEMAPTRDTEVVADAVAEAALEGGNENDGKASMKRDLSGFDLPARTYSAASDSDNAAPEEVLACEQVRGSCVGHMAPAGLPKLKRSCSNIETTRSSPKASGLPARSRSYDDLEHFPASVGAETTPNVPAGSPASVKTSCTADRVMLKKRSSSQLLPSRSRKLWWRLFLWSHRNLHRPWTTKPTTPSLHNADASVSQQHDGYTSDTLDVGPAMADRKNKKVAMEDTPIPNQWVAFSAEASSLDRVSAWVNSLENGSFHAEEEDDMEHEDGVVRVRCTKIKESSGKNIAQARRHGPAEEVFQANSIMQTLNTFSSVAHISGMGLKAVPMISAFSSLRAVNLSSNFIVHISPGSLPKGLHSLDLSRNNIANIEGLRELTRLRVLNLSYNRISRIGYGLSNCTAIKELFLAGNKISDVEGLHRMLKLTVLDLSFNKITTTKALGQLVANYNSLLALNLLGNPIQSNISDDALRKAASGLLPRLTYLNKQPIKPQRVREVATDSVAKAALGNSGRSSRRRLSRRLSQSPGSSVKGRGGEGSRSRPKSRHQSSSLTRK